MNEYMSFGFRAQDALGLFQYGSEFSYTTFRRIAFLSIIFCFFTTGVVEITRTYHDLRHVNDIISLLWLGMMGTSKYLTLLHFRQRVTELRDTINGYRINEDSSSDDDAILAKYDKMGKKYSLIFSYLGFVLGLGMMTQNLPTYFRSNILTLPVILNAYPFDLNNTGWFLLAYFHQVAAFVTYILIFTAANAQFIGLTAHSLGHFCVLNNYAEKFSEAENWVEYGNMGPRERIKKCTKLHQNVLQLTEDLEDFHTWPNFIHFLVSAVGLCTSAYELRQGQVTVDQIGKHVAGVVGQFAQLFLVNYCGQLLQDTSFEVSRAIYRTNFHKLEPCYQKDLMFILARAQKPVYITAGKFSVLSMENIINILKATSTYFAMFATLDSQPED